MSSLLAFARAARSASFKRAAAELHLSSSALSRQIQALEEHLGVPLFRRLNPGLELTEEGRRYLEVVDAVLARLQSARDAIVVRNGPLTTRVVDWKEAAEAFLEPAIKLVVRR